MEKIEIKLKECCLDCEYYYPEGIGMGSFVACGSCKREISCLHMPVCKQYNNDCKKSADSIVRCKSCAHFILQNEKPFCHIHSEYTSPEYFCGSAVRVEDDQR